ncbi:MAG: LTA synthase family protein, partial [Firmicutes bacterium]|nr:LTA synthase family protein [Bacillota bacterium]
MGIIDRFVTEKLSGPISFFRKLQSRGILYTIYHSFLIYLIVEMLSRRSPIEGISYLITEPAVFIYNWILVMATMSLALLFRKRGFAFLLVSFVWLLLGVINCVLLGFRTTPLNFMDFRTFKDVMGIMNVYFSPVQLMAMSMGVIVFIGMMLFLLIRTPSEKIAYRKSGAAVACFCALLMGSTFVSLGNGTLITTFHNIQDAYKDYGFAYCFAASVVDRGISRPQDYSQESIDEILAGIDEAAGEEGNAEIIRSDAATEETPNIIILQMESFFDPKTLKGVTFSEDPVPNFTSMMQNYSSGWLTTPSFGAGTANTEYEVNTGMSVAYFGPGEYPYTTVLRKTTSESMANNLRAYGYSSHAIHNHTGKFYGRYLVYPYLGFDSFTSVEYMQDVERNPLNWSDDSILTGEIQKSMESTAGQDYVFAVSVQGHGKYPSEQIDDTQVITVDGFNEEETTGFEYYVNQINRMDAFLGELTEALSAGSEPTVLVIYGDHLPKFTI